MNAFQRWVAVAGCLLGLLAILYLPWTEYQPYGNYVMPAGYHWRFSPPESWEMVIYSPDEAKLTLELLVVALLTGAGIFAGSLASKPLAVIRKRIARECLWLLGCLAAGCIGSVLLWVRNKLALDAGETVVLGVGLYLFFLFVRSLMWTAMTLLEWTFRRLRS